MTSKQKAESKKNVLDFHFGRYYRLWIAEEEVDTFNDDRNIFLRMYEQLSEAIDAMAKMNNSFVWVAFNGQMKEQEKEMCEIVKRFTGSYPIYGMNSIYDPDTLDIAKELSDWTLDECKKHCESHKTVNSFTGRTHDCTDCKLRKICGLVPSSYSF